ncbi:Maf family nucleotide pyrophosphatase [uncultured Alistipes sp.]|uniref:Maf family nucleotide pyrophosphatase n=1 Tax=uncultured Alistipes sp. TaxID=538949 RepID=UPI002627252A|nr:Maf family nucleotide pyrophosphatase [uncultured Alistipes sp.]
MFLIEKLKDYRLILASRSPRRRQLLADCGLDFTLACDYEAEERYPADLAPESVPVFLSELKSEAYPRPLAAGEILITADTVVVAAGRILGKPSGRDEAVSMLRLLSGRTHSVVTGVTLRDASRRKSFDSRTAVTFRTLSEEEIAYYVDRYRPYDKAGSYGIQEWIGYVAIERIEGSFYNVMGLPVQKLYTALNDFTER